MSEELSVTLKKFNDRIRAMNQTRSKDILLTADDARNLHTEIFGILAQVSDLTAKLSSLEAGPKEELIVIDFDGGKF